MCHIDATRRFAAAMMQQYLRATSRAASERGTSSRGARRASLKLDQAVLSARMYQEACQRRMSPHIGRPCSGQNTAAKMAARWLLQALMVRSRCGAPLKSRVPRSSFNEHHAPLNFIPNRRRKSHHLSLYSTYGLHIRCDNLHELDRNFPLTLRDADARWTAPWRRSWAT